MHDRATEHHWAQFTQFLHIFYEPSHIEAGNLNTQKELYIPTM